MKGAEIFLSKTLGEDFLESLVKFELWKPGTKSVTDHEEIRTALQIVPRTIIALLIRELSPMEIGQTKEIRLFVGAEALLRVTKHERDVYSGEIEEKNKKLTEFKFRSIPGVGLIIMSAFELYDMENLINSPIKSDSLAEDAHSKIQKAIDERLALHDLISKVVDKKIQERDAIHEILLMKLTEELKKERDAAEKARVQLAAAGVAALGYATGNNDVKPGDYGHSASFDDVKKLRDEHDKLKEDISSVTKIAKSPGNADANEYMRGMANGLEIADSVVNKKEPQFVEAPKRKGSPIKEYLDSRKKIKKSEFSIELAKGEKVDCPDCGKNIFDGSGFSGCICLGDDMGKKVFIKKNEDGINVRFGRGWDKENIIMLLEMLRRKRG